MADEPTRLPEDPAKPAHPNLVDLLVRIPVFEDLVPAECKKILTACNHAVFAAGETIYEAGSPGNQMLILLRGVIKIVSVDGKELTEIHALDTVGEVEIGTSLNRMANVVAGSEVAGMTVSKGGLEGIIQSDPLLGIKILRNILRDVARKLAATDATLASHLGNDPIQSAPKK